MHNINYIRDNPVEFDNFMKTRGENPIANKIIEIDKVKRETQTVLQNLLAERNQISKTIGQLKSQNKDASKEMDRVEDIKTSQVPFIDAIKIAIESGKFTTTNAAVFLVLKPNSGDRWRFCLHSRICLSKKFEVIV